jgi:hypothetical protein
MNTDNTDLDEDRVIARDRVIRKKPQGRSDLLLLLYPYGGIAYRYFKPGRVWL